MNLLNINSREFNIDDKADVIIHEQIGAFMFDNVTHWDIQILRTYR
ncbi:MAG: hypothetical protein IPM38_06755 [Ignavibacteria bacterium]|nr:hypothetical protein [Ignavibacteria bacterium]